MAEELGKIEKPEAGQFREKRKLYLIPLLFSWEGAPAEYVEQLNLYWQQVKEHVANLESKIGKVNRIYHESITLAGEEGLKVMEKLNPSGCQIVRDKCRNGAELEVIEDRELSEESMDWQKHLLMGFLSQKVAQVVSDFYVAAARKRYEHIARRIDETLKDNEVAMLFTQEGHMVQFPPDIEVFSVAPPVLDTIHRWLRDRPSTDKEGEP
ncbi:MAG: hypothetical protein HYY80_03720 [Chloroflexi bacterium]|nr:hypothetical protein [Chloroflexota bacterium]